MAIDSLLLPEGFVKLAVLGKDAVYVSLDQVRELPEGLMDLPKRILWNEPGSESETIEYRRFQRFFGIDGDLDVDVGDQRLLNETELARQWNRTDAKYNASLAEVMQVATTAAVGGVLSKEQQEVFEQPWVQEILSDSEVRRAMNTMAMDEHQFLRDLNASTRLQDKLKQLIEVDLIRHDGAKKLLGYPVESNMKEKSKEN
eukprot:TRINITY_DN10107_c0_g1_i1.p1 TRINITY_DN10107_c0_g1~~TRINITY_DN10107_c0_g1_i1.p1  ORF type:complete len:201 (-),score=43.91 TRINITY_DN10107_c0_g1_i1:125-727(-)